MAQLGLGSCRRSGAGMTANNDLTISMLVVIDGPENTNGNSLLAVFDLRISGINIASCVLTRKRDGIVKASGPMGKTHRGHQITVTLEDPALARAITRKAATAYSALTGREVVDE